MFLKNPKFSSRFRKRKLGGGGGLGRCFYFFINTVLSVVNSVSPGAPLTNFNDGGGGGVLTEVHIL